MKHQMSSRAYENLSYAFIGLSTGYIRYLNIHFPTEYWDKAVQAGLTAGVCGAMGWIGKKIVEVAYSYVKEYFQQLKAKRLLKKKPKK